MLDACIAVEMPIGPHRVHFFPETGDLAAGDQRIGIAVAYQDPRHNPLVGGQGGFEQAVKAHHGSEILPVARHFEHSHAAEAETDRHLRHIGFEPAQKIERGTQALAHCRRVTAQPAHGGKSLVGIGRGFAPVEIADEHCVTGIDECSGLRFDRGGGVHKGRIDRHRGAGRGGGPRVKRGQRDRAVFISDLLERHHSGRKSGTDRYRSPVS